MFFTAKFAKIYKLGGLSPGNWCNAPSADLSILVYHA